MSLWDWSLEAYGQPGVPEACLALQDGHGQNTSLLLWAVWAEPRMRRCWPAPPTPPIAGRPSH